MLEPKETGKRRACKIKLEKATVMKLIVTPKGCLIQHDENNYNFMFEGSVIDVLAPIKFKYPNLLYGCS